MMPSSLDRTPLALSIPAENMSAVASEETSGGEASSYAAQMALDSAILGGSGQTDDGGQMNRMMLAKMQSLQDSLGDVVREMRSLRGSAVPSTADNSDGSTSGGRRRIVSRTGSGSGSIGSPHTAVLDVSGERRGSRVARTPVKTPERRTAMRRQDTKEWIGEGPMPVVDEATDRRKGKEVMIASDVDSDGISPGQPGPSGVSGGLI